MTWQPLAPDAFHLTRRSLIGELDDAGAEGRSQPPPGRLADARAAMFAAVAGPG